MRHGAAGAAAGHRAGGLDARSGGRNRAAARNQALPPPGKAAGTPVRRGRTQPRPVPSRPVPSPPVPSRPPLLPLRDPLRGRAAALGSRRGGSGRGLRLIPAPRPAPPRPHPRGRPLRCGGRASAGADRRRRGPSVQPSIPRSASASLRPPFPAPLPAALRPPQRQQGRSCPVMAGRPRFLCGVVEGRSCRGRGWGPCPARALQGLARHTRRAPRSGRAAGTRARRARDPGYGRGSAPGPCTTLDSPTGWGSAPPAEAPKLTCRALMGPAGIPAQPAPSTALWRGALLPCRQRSAVAFSLPRARGRHPAACPPAPCPQRIVGMGCACQAAKSLISCGSSVWLSPCPSAPLSFCFCSTAPLELREVWHLLVKSISTFSGSTSPRCSPLPAALPRREEAKTPSKYMQIK